MLIDLQMRGLPSAFAARGCLAHSAHPSPSLPRLLSAPLLLPAHPLGFWGCSGFRETAGMGWASRQCLKPSSWPAAHPAPKALVISGLSSTHQPRKQVTLPSLAVQDLLPTAAEVPTSFLSAHSQSQQGVKHTWIYFTLNGTVLAFWLHGKEGTRGE